MNEGKRNPRWAGGGNVTFICEHCKKEFIRWQYPSGKPKRFCSHLCAMRWRGEHRDQTGHNNPNWKGGYRKPKPQYIQIAQSIVNHAKRDGKLIPLPCEVCGNVKSEAHHRDYSKPLEVQWLCRKHHVAADKIRRINE